MSSRGEIVGAVDFGSHAVRVLIARRDPEGAIRVIGHGAASGRGCVSQGVIQDLSAAQTAFGRALGDAEQAAHVHVRTLFCGINGRSVETSIQEGRVKLEDGIVEPRHLKAALDQASRTILAADKQITSSVKAQEWFVDDQRVINPVGIRGQVLKIREHFACLPAVIADNLDGCVQAQGREIENFIFLPLASALGCLTPEDMELGIAVLDIGHSTTGLALYRDHSVIDTCCFNLGGNHITRDVVAGLQISFEEAEQLVREYGVAEYRIRAGCEPAEADDAQADAPLKLRTAVRGAPDIVPRGKLDDIIYRRAREILMKVLTHLESEELTRHLVRGVVLAGGTGALKNYPSLSETLFHVPCQVGLPDTVEFPHRAIYTPEFTAIAGILRHGFAYRDAVRRGGLDARTPVHGGLRGLLELIRRYFF